MVHKESFRHIHLQVLQLCCYVSHFYDVLTHTLHVSESQQLMSLNDENFIIRVSANALSEISNCSSMAFSKALTSLCWSTEPRIPADILVFMNMMLRRLDRS